jgi:uncharacterized hydrophobic protein (TIGR00341 family)
MSLRLVEVLVAEDLAEPALEVLREVGVQQLWRESGAKGEAKLRAVLDADSTGAALDRLHGRISHSGGLRVLVLPLDAALPRPRPDEEGLRSVRPAAVSREAVHAIIAREARLTGVFASLVLLSTTVAALGLSRDDTAVVIGAMVLAPLLGPNMGVALGLTLADLTLARSAARTGLVGLALAVACAALLGLGLDVDPALGEIASRTRVDLRDVAIALAAGTAGALAYTTSAPASLVGVMVAVALLPPAAACGLMLSVGELRGALGAALLVLANVAAVNLAAMATFVSSGLRPRSGWSAERAKRSRAWGLFLWALVLAVLAAAILASQRLELR